MGYNNYSQIDFQALNEAALKHCPRLLEKLLPGGRVVGKRYHCATIRGGKGDSCRIELETGLWADFATDDKGGDIISLVAAIKGVKQPEAARILADMIDYSLPATGNAARSCSKPKEEEQKPTPIIPVPDDAPQPNFRHNRYGEPTEFYAYKDKDGKLMGYNRRFVLSELDSHGKNKKVFVPLTYFSSRWADRGFSAPRPFYGLERLANLPPGALIVVVEGEHKADKLRALIGHKIAVLSLCGGCNSVAKMDFEPLRGRDVIFWPDNDEGGFKAAKAFVEKSRGIVASLKIITPPPGKPETWDCGDAVEKDGWDYDRVMELINAAVALTETEKSNKESAPICYDIATFLTMELPERKTLLTPFLEEQAHAMIYAQPGVGKTHLAMSIAWAVARGGDVFGDGKWIAREPRRVHYLDGEMSAKNLQERFSQIGDADITWAENLRILSASMQPEGMASISTREGQEFIDSLLIPGDLVIIDNLATLASYGKSNEMESWEPMQTWLLGLRRRNITALLIHHAGKSGDQLGTSAREHILETVITLTPPKGYDPKEGARFEVHFKKHRNFYGKDAGPFEATLSQKDGRQVWITKSLETVDLERLRELLDAGYSLQDCANELGYTKSKIQRLKKKIEHELGKF